ncbi:MAG: hypothetical protein COW00_12970 [Bdellovibrio sp. CG12_big_fil_rev_8_21_14_0_65_39_13]|nr:MAG: hypothetical protein COW78_05290 [Bdellovibrio sp. CG22_combo_CG10-13_8_21_14_all_39_27]PIQ58992.1 MAG: hypothetical protein COW00_12970 [Bdellovibrio sp. CG12_big_fil_rev_8_21_14_0_65_39_13]PIR33959.1 MAG: hypothetical protein COV37_14685 [Bdellovibrio sp. CG11_big_fil_rev_8_21_14_0_20_39_38]
MKNFINASNWFYRLQQLVILILHFVLLYWMFYALTESGSLTTFEVSMHFVGMAIFGASLIRGCAYWARYHHLKEQTQNHA